MRDFPVARMMKNLPAMQDTQVQSLGSEHLPEKEMTTHSSILAWKIPWTEKRSKTIHHGATKSWTGLSN